MDPNQIREVPIQQYVVDIKSGLPKSEQEGISRQNIFQKNKVSVIREVML